MWVVPLVFKRLPRRRGQVSFLDQDCGQQMWHNPSIDDDDGLKCTDPRVCTRNPAPRWLKLSRFVDLCDFDTPPGTSLRRCGRSLGSRRVGSLDVVVRLLSHRLHPTYHQQLAGVLVDEVP